MKQNWFETKVRYDKTLDTGMIKPTTEAYLVDALSYTEAETRIIEEIKPYITGEFSIAGIVRKKYAETYFNGVDGYFHAVKLAYITLDEKSGTEKYTKLTWLVEAETVDEALKKTHAELKQTMIDYRVLGVAETAIMDIFLYNGENSGVNGEEENQEQQEAD